MSKNHRAAPARTVFCAALALATSAFGHGFVGDRFFPPTINSDDQLSEFAIVARRFSWTSLVAVGCLLITGLIDSWCLVGSLHGLFPTPYGRALMIKLGLFIVMVGLGAINVLLLVPRLRTSRRTAGRLMFNVLAEVLMGSVIILIVGFLGMMEPARH